MLIAKVENGEIRSVSEHWALFPNTLFPSGGPDDAFLAANGCLKVNQWRDHDSTAQKLVSSAPYIDGNWVYTVRVMDLTSDELIARDNAAKAQNKARASTLLAATDYLTLPDASAQITNMPEILTYRAALRTIALNPPVVVESWPVKPDTAWDI